MIVIGALGFAKELLEVLRENTSRDFVFFDDATENLQGCIHEHYEVLRSKVACKEYFSKDNRFILGIGNPQSRYALCTMFESMNGDLQGIASSKASIGIYNNIHKTCTVMPQVVIENDNAIGKGVLLHVGAFVSHDVAIGDFCEISPYAKLLGRCQMGNFCSIGAGAIILPDVKIGNNVMVGAGAVVTRDVEDAVTVLGIPARKK
jgi:sugar O-acyltransferase (sialic acid O-acetyltransferase NeuD family)